MKKILTVPVAGRLIVNDALTHLEACLAGMGIAQVFELGIESLLKSGKLINLFPDWSDEVFPLYVYHTSRHFVPAKVRAFLDFLGASFLTPLDQPYPMIATGDIGELAAQILQEAWTGNRCIELEGPARYSQLNVAKTFSRLLNRTVTAKP